MLHRNSLSSAKTLAAVLLFSAAATGMAQPARAQVTGPATLRLGKTPLGQMLVGDKGMALYMYTKDSPGVTVCYDRCAVAWPPLLTNGAPITGPGIKQELIGSVKRKDGAQQVTYNGWPLYYWFRDKAAGEIRGQDVGKVWYVMNAAGAIINTQVAYVGIGASPMGDALIGTNGMSLYMFTKDSKAVSACYDKCAVNWPPLLTQAKPVAEKGVRAGLIGTSKRTDGTLQVTYNGMPVYYWINDKAIGDWTGQAVGDAWWVVTPQGKANSTPPPARVTSGKTPYGDILVGKNGLSVYMFTKDSGGASACYDKCAEIWPPVLTDLPPVAGPGAQAKLLGTIKRADGKLQVTYNGMPLYYFASDKAAGDLNGQNVNGVWFVLQPAGEVLRPG